MSGLIEKDLRLLLQRKSTLLIILGISLMMSFTMDNGFVVGYLVVLGVVFATGTISYDEYDNGYPFLMTLPIDRKTYVDEKYIFCILSGFVMWVIGCILYFASFLLRGIKIDVPDEMLQLCAFLPVIVLMTAVMIPFPLKYGAEKGRIVMVLVCGAMGAVIVFIRKGIEYLPVSVESVLKMIARIPELLGILLIVGVLALLLFISYLCSRHIMDHKVF